MIKYILISLCLITTYNPSILKQEKKEENIVDISIKVTPKLLIESSSANFIAYSITNNTTKNIEFGTYFELEFFNGSTWEVIPHRNDMVFNDILYYVTPNKSSSYEKTYIEPQCRSGLYRIKKEIDNLSKNRADIVYAEFILIEE